MITIFHFLKGGGNIQANTLTEGKKTGSCLNIQDLVRNGGSCLISKRLREQAIQDLFGCASGPSSFGEYGMEDIDLNMKRCLLRAPPLFDLSARF